ncbi:5557_t:CDS:1, partial [Gigaspora margarita]
KRVNKTSTGQKSSKRIRLAKNSTGISRECSELSIGDHEDILRIEREKLNIQKDKNNELEREIMLREKLQKLQNN